MNGRSKYGRIRIQERVGSSLIQSLGNKSPWKNKGCGRDCHPCESKEGSCRQRNITYRISCQLCLSAGVKYVYIGESHRSWWDRAQDHDRALKSMDETYATVTHHQEFHPNETPAFSFKVDRSHKSSLQRQIFEAILIQEEKCDNLLNKRGEWGMNSLPEHTTYDERRARTGALQDPRRDNKRQRQDDSRETDSNRQTGSSRQDRLQDDSNPFNTQFSKRKAEQRKLETDSLSISTSTNADRQFFSNGDSFSSSRTVTAFKRHVHRIGRQNVKK